MIRAVAVYDNEVPRWEVRSLIDSFVLWKGKSMTAIVAIGIDLAKNIFACSLPWSAAEVQDVGLKAVVKRHCSSSQRYCYEKTARQ